MIKAEDLRIGDLVKVNEVGCMIPKGTMCKVVAIDSEKSFEEMNLKGCATLIELEVNHCNISWGIWCKYISPIPLTPEILKKNEFDYLNEEVVTYNKRIHRGIILVLRPYGKVFDVIIKRNWHAMECHIRYIEYIHELQHLLWALGRNANLKI